MLNWLKYVFLKIITLGKRDIRLDELRNKRSEKLSKVLMMLRKTSTGDWMFEKDVKIVKDRIYHKKHVGDDFIGDGCFIAFYMPRYEIDETKPPIEIYENLPYFFSLNHHDKGFMTFSSSDKDVFCSGRLVGMVNSETVIEYVSRNATQTDVEILGFFENLRVHFKKKKLTR